MRRHEIKTIATCELKKNPRNTKIHTGDQIDQIAYSIERFGFTAPLVIDGQNQIIAGHGRYAAALKLNILEVPCVVAADLTRAEVIALGIADNKIAEGARWDFENLELELKEAADLDNTIDFLDLGFNDEELGEFLGEDLNGNGDEEGGGDFDYVDDGENKDFVSLAPFPYFGGKSRIAKIIAAVMPEHKIYIEPFAGGGSVFYAKKPTACEILNDYGADVYNLWKTIKRYPATLTDRVKELIISQELFNDYCEGRYNPINDIERAAVLYMCLVIGLNAMASKDKHRYLPLKKYKTKNIYRDFTKFAGRLKRAAIYNEDFEAIINRHSERDDTFYYLDPPYFEMAHYYQGRFSSEDHERLFNALTRVKGKWLVSYNDAPEIKELYNIYNQKRISFTYSVNPRWGNTRRVDMKRKVELLISNYDFEIPAEFRASDAN